jgi:hypothetical protein
MSSRRRSQTTTPALRTASSPDALAGTRERDAARTAAVAALVMLAGALHVAWLRFAYDDAWITYRYADHFARGFGLVFNPGERVEGYSNFLWTVLLAAGIRLGADPETLAPQLGALAMLGALGVVLAAAARARVSPFAAGTLVAASPAWAAWATGGLETGLFTLLVTAGMVALGFALRAPRPGHALVASALALGLGTLTRPNGPLFVAVAGAFLAAHSAWGRLPWRATLGWAWGIAVIVLPHLLWRRAYYGEWLPNTYFVKQPGLERVDLGAAYLGDAFLDLGAAALALAVLLALVLRARWRGDDSIAWAPLAAAVAAHLGYVATTGGDFMPVYRLVAPVVPLAGLIAAAALGGAADRLGACAPAAARAAVTVVLALAVALGARESWRQQSVWSKGELVSVGWARAEIEDWGRIGDLLRRIAAPTDTLAVSPAGIIPYRSRLYTIDMNALNTAGARDTSVFRRRATRRPGHELTLHERRLVERPPQILLGHPLVHPTPASLALGLELRPEWHDRVLAAYESVGLTLAGDPPRFVGCAVRRDAADRLLDAGRVGARRGAADSLAASELAEAAEIQVAARYDRDRGLAGPHGDAPRQ